MSSTAQKPDPNIASCWKPIIMPFLIVTVLKTSAADAVAANASSRLLNPVHHEAVEINRDVMGFDLDAVLPRWRIEITL